MADVIATQRGYYGRILREPGDVFVVRDGEKASWFRPVSGAGEIDAPVAQADSAPDADPPKRGRKPKAETVQAPAAEPFADPQIAGEVAQAGVGAQPDWVQPGAEI